LTLSKLFRLFEPREQLTVTQWADRYRWLSKEAHSTGGKYDSAFAPFQREPMDSANDCTVTKTVLMFASQLTGKTEIANNVIGFHIDWRPSPILVVQPTQKPMGEAWSKDRLVPMIRDTPRLKGLVAGAKSRDSGNTIFHKSFPGGHVSIGGANSPSNLASRPIRVVILDEVDRYPVTAGKEGNPCELAIKRTETFPDAVVFEIGSPTIKGASRIASSFEASDKRYFFVPCPKCSYFQTLKWCNVLFSFPILGGTGDPPGSSPATVLERRPADAVLVCDNPECRAHLTDADRLAMIYDARSHWRATAPFTGVRGFHLNGLYTPFKPKRGYRNRLHQAAAEFLAAKKKGHFDIMVWVNTFLAETYEEIGDRSETKDLLKRRENYGPELPPEVLVLTMAVDVQGDRLELEVTGWGADFESWAVQYLIIPGNPLQPQVWRELDAVLERTWRARTEQSAESKAQDTPSPLAPGSLPAPRELHILCTTIDSSAYTDEVLGYTKPRFARRVFAVRGSNIPGQPLVGTISRNNRRRAPVYRIGTDTAKSIVHGRLKLEASGPGYMHYPRGDEYGFDDVYFSGLTAEEPRVVYTKGIPKRVWVKTRPRNEPLDIRVYAAAAIAILQPDWNVLTKRLAAKIRTYTLQPYSDASPTPADSNATLDPNQIAAARANPQASKTVRPSKPPGSSKKNFVTGWKKY